MQATGRPGGQLVNAGGQRGGAMRARHGARPQIDVEVPQGIECAGGWTGGARDAGVDDDACSRPQDRGQCWRVERGHPKSASRLALGQQRMQGRGGAMTIQGDRVIVWRRVQAALGRPQQGPQRLRVGGAQCTGFSA